VDLEPLQDRPAVRDLVMLICALLHRADRPAWLALLRAPWAGLELADLLALARARPIIWDALREEGVLEGLSEEGRLRCGRLRAVLETAFEVQSHTSAARWVERTWIALGGPACAADIRDLEHVRAVFARLRKLEEQGLPDAADLPGAFADLYAKGDPADAVEIMTIHKSKGLEFDCVIVPALDRHGRSHPGQLLLTHPFSRTERPGMVMAARPPVGARNALFDYLRRLAREGDSLESERLLYVACTRAKYQLHLTATVGPHADPDALPGEEGDEDRPPQSEARRAPHAGSLLAVLCRVKRIEDAFAVPQAASMEDEAELAGLRGGPLVRMPRAWSPPPLEARSFAPVAATAIEREETPVFDWAGETARRIGSLVHAELQSLDLERSDPGTLRARKPHYERWLALHGVPAERVSQASERVIGAVAAVHRDPRARWILKKGYRDDFREHALSGYWRGEVVRAVFDRSFIDEDGIRWVIDYKTSQHSGGGLQEFLDREVERYRPQLERYAALAGRLGPERVRVGLYFPLMSAWREWDP
jgi:ATP-dependent exoDNAse (exonuclease V) beta subunit